MSDQRRPEDQWVEAVGATMLQMLMEHKYDVDAAGPAVWRMIENRADAEDIKLQLAQSAITTVLMAMREGVLAASGRPPGEASH